MLITQQIVRMSGMSTYPLTYLKSFSYRPFYFCTRNTHYIQLIHYKPKVQNINYIQIQI